MNQYLRNEESQAEIARIATNVSVNATKCALQEGLNSIPGGSPAYTIILRSLRTDKKTEPKEQKKIKALQDKVERLEKEAIACRSLLEQQEIEKKAMVVSNQKPEDVIKVFMMTEFVGLRLLDNLIVPGVRHGRKSA